MNIFVQAQALDNASPDPAFAGGVLDEALDRDVLGQFRQRMADVMINARAIEVGQVVIHRGAEELAIVAPTHDRDARGRPSPVVILVSEHQSTNPEELVDKVAEAVKALGRSLQADALRDGLEEWNRKKAIIRSRAADCYLTRFNSSKIPVILLLILLGVASGASLGGRAGALIGGATGAAMALAPTALRAARHETTRRPR